jgi:hypothetical protein
VLHGLIFVLSELVFYKVLGRRSFHVVLEQHAYVALCVLLHLRGSRRCGWLHELGSTVARPRMRT